MKICVNLTDEDRRNLIEFYSNRSVAYFYLVCSVLSLVVSVVNVTVLTRPRMLRNSLNVMLAALETANLFLSLMHIPMFIVRISIDNAFEQCYKIMYVALTTAIWADVVFIIWMTVVISIWRYLAISHPLRCRVWLRRSRALLVVFTLIFLCIILSGAQFLGFRYEFKYYHKNCSVLILPDVYDRIWASYSPRERLFWANIYVALNYLTYLVPVVCFLITHFLIARKLLLSRNARESLQEGVAQREAHETRSTIILLILLFTFLSAHIPPCLLVGIQLGRYDYEGVPLPWEETLWEFIPGLVVNVGSFGGYYCMNPMFRETFRQIRRKIIIFSYPESQSTTANADTVG